MKIRLLKDMYCGDKGDEFEITKQDNMNKVLYFMDDTCAIHMNNIGTLIEVYLDET